ncbi:hypothetical protein T09_14062 [Trichinella sp. T9]|nr:hypothetical protein T09_14062 [Trichinella sp. T9]
MNSFSCFTTQQRSIILKKEPNQEQPTNQSTVYLPYFYKQVTIARLIKRMLDAIFQATFQIEHILCSFLVGIEKQLAGD